MTQLLPKKYSGTKGFCSSRPRHLVPPEYITDASLDWMYYPSENKLMRRLGCLQVNDAPLMTDVDSGVSPTPDWRARGRIIATRSLSNATGDDPLRYLLLTDEVNDYVGLYTSQATAPPVPGMAIDSGSALGSSYWYDASVVFPNLGYDARRLITNKQKLRLATGSRNFLEGGDWIGFPALGAKDAYTNGGCIPSKWNKQWSGSGLGTKEYILPLGHVPPILPVTCTGSGAGTGWTAGDKFYYLVMFQYNDGSFSSPSQIRPPGGLVPNGVHYFSLAAGGSYITVANIPIGTKDVKARYLLRSLVVTGANEPDPDTIGVVYIMDNNTTTTYRDYYPQDEQVALLPESIRDDGIWAPPARAGWAFDQRFAVGYVRPNPAAILVIPYETATGSPSEETSRHSAETGGAGLATRYYHISKSGSNFYFWQHDNNSAAAPAGNFCRHVLAVPATYTLQDVVDEINSYAFGAAASTSGYFTFTTIAAPYAGARGTGSRFYAALVPGADGSALATDIADFGAGFGDQFPKDSVDYDYQRVFCNAIPGLMRMSTDWFNRYPARKRTVYFTGGGPGHAPNAMNNWYAGNYRDALDTVGDFVGGASLLDGSLVFFTKGVCALRNIRDGKTGIDDDYRLEVIDGSVGCISADSIVSVNGAVIYMSEVGLMVTDGERFECISKAVYDHGTKTGEWAYEVGLSIDASQQDTDNAYFGCSVIESRLWVSYRKSSDNDPDRIMCYDFTEQPESAGVGQFLDDEGEALPWGSPLRVPLYALGPGRHDGVTAHLGFRGGTTEGQIDVFEYDTSDNQTSVPAVVAITPVAYFATDDFGTDKKKSPRVATLKYKKIGTGLTLGVTKHLGAHTTPALYTTLTPGTSPAGFPYDMKRMEIPLAGRGPSDIVEFRAVDDGSGPRPEIWYIDSVVEILDSYY